MKRLLSLFLCMLFPLMVYGGDYTQQQSWVTDEVITATKLNVDIQGLTTTINDLTNDNIANNADIVYSKLNLSLSIANADISAAANIGNNKLQNPNSYFTIALTSDGQYDTTVDPLRTFQMPFAATLIEVSVCARDIDTAEDETYTIDIEEAGTTVLDSAIPIVADNTVAVGTITDADIADNAKIEVVLTIGGTTPTIDDITILLTFKVAHIG